MVWPILAPITVIIGGLLYEWIWRRVYARSQSRLGPIIAGPAGILQPFADIIKLASKEDVVTKPSVMPKLQAMTLCLAIGALAALATLVPVASGYLAARGDVIVALYLALWPAVAIAMLGLLNPNPYGAVGTTRLIALLLLAEPAILASLLVPPLLEGKLSIALASEAALSLWAKNPVAMALCLAGMIVAVSVKLMARPFDAPEAEAEIVAGPLIEVSGSRLALVRIMHDVELFVYTLLISYLFLGGPAPLTGIPGIILAFVKQLAVLFVVLFVHSASGRLRPWEAQRVAGIAAALSIIGLILAILTP